MIYFSWANCVELFLICIFSTLRFLVFTNGRFLFLIIWVRYSLRVYWQKSCDWKHLQFSVFYACFYNVFCYKSEKTCFFYVFYLQTNVLTSMLYTPPHECPHTCGSWLRQWRCPYRLTGTATFWKCASSIYDQTVDLTDIALYCMMSASDICFLLLLVCLFTGHNFAVIYPL